MKKRKVMVAMSGGVDSSVAALLLKESGCDVVGVTMCLGVSVPESDKVRCCGPKEIEDAASVCRLLNIRHYVLDFSRLLREKVIDNFVAEYLRGRTPNPCVECNRHLKFGALLDKARAMGFDFLATGHYAALGTCAGETVLKKPKDRLKDQTYFLYGIEALRLKYLLFPLAEYGKPEIRDIAEKNGLSVVACKPQSQDICFIPDGDRRGFLEREIPAAVPGPIVDREGKTIGQHRGIIHYTIGQRIGLDNGSNPPRYVMSIDQRKNQLTAGEKKDLHFREIILEKVNLHVPDLPEKAVVKIRYRSREIPCGIERGRSGTLRLLAGETKEAAAPGQSAVLYQDDILLGGGIIKTAL